MSSMIPSYAYKNEEVIFIMVTQNFNARKLQSTWKMEILEEQISGKDGQVWDVKAQATSVDTDINAKKERKEDKEHFYN